MGGGVGELIHRITGILRERNMASLVVGAMALGIMRGPMDWMLPLLLLERSSPELIGITFALANADDTVMAFVGGQLADRFGRRLLIIFSTSFYIVGCLALIMSHVFTDLGSLVSLCAAVILLFGVTGLSSGPYSALVSESVREDLLGRAFAALALVVNLARAGGSMFIGLLFVFNRSAAFILMLCFAVIGLISHIKLRETLLGLDGTKDNVPIMTYLKTSTLGLKETLCQGFWPIVLLIALVGLAHGTSGNYFSPYLNERFLLDERWIGSLYSSMFILQAVSMPLAGWLTDRRGLVLALSIGNLIPAVCLFLFALTTSPVVAGVAMLMSGTLSSIGSVSQNVAINRLAKPEIRATLFGVTVGVFNLMFVIGPLMGGFLFVCGHSLPFLVGGMVFVMTVVPIVLIRARI